MTTPFFEIYVRSEPLGGSVVFWGMQRTFCDPPPYHFELQWAETAEGNWETVPTGELVDTYWAIDPVQRLWAKELESFYRLILTTEKDRYESFAQQASGVWTKRDWLKAREICRLEALLQKRFTGTMVHLLKRKIWGAPCPVCADWDTEEVSQGKCETCYGAGKEGGYWPSYLTYFSEVASDPPRKKGLNDTLGMAENVHIPVRMIAYPHLATYDVLVDPSTGKRYVINSVQDAAKIRGIPIVNLAEIRLAPFTDIVYKIPLQPSPYEQPVEEFLFETRDAGGLLPAPVAPPLPETPPPPPPVEPEPEPEPEPEIHVPLAPFFGLWWEQNAWWLGNTIGNEAIALFKTMDGIANPFLLAKFSWIAVAAPSDAILSLTAVQNGFTVSSSVEGVSGTYLRAGTYSSIFAYLQQP